MKNAVKVLGFVFLVSLVAYAGRSFVTPSDAAVNCGSVNSFTSQGFTMSEVTPNQYRYLVPPTGDHIWGDVTVRMYKRVGGDMSLTTEWATVRCEIFAKKQGGTWKYSVSGNPSVNVTTVY